MFLQMLDRDGDGYLTDEELRYALTHSKPPVSEMDASIFIDEADINHDGMIDYKGKTISHKNTFFSHVFYEKSSGVLFTPKVKTLKSH